MRLIHGGFQVKRRQIQSYKCKEFDKPSISLILKNEIYTRDLLHLLENICKYQMDPANIVEDTERTPFCPQTDEPTDGQGETSIPYFQIRWIGGIVILHISSNTPLRVPYHQVWYKNGNRIFRSCRVMRILRDIEYHLQHSVSIYHLLSNIILS